MAARTNIDKGPSQPSGFNEREVPKHYRYLVNDVAIDRSREIADAVREGGAQLVWTTPEGVEYRHANVREQAVQELSTAGNELSMQLLKQAGVQPNTVPLAPQPSATAPVEAQLGNFGTNSLAEADNIHSASTSSPAESITPARQEIYPQPMQTAPGAFAENNPLLEQGATSGLDLANIRQTIQNVAQPSQLSARTDIAAAPNVQADAPPGTLDDFGINYEEIAAHQQPVDPRRYDLAA
jgi:hypothetical protein